MNAVGIIGEYNPFHKGHIYHLNETKKLFPNRPLILVLNGYFLQRGEVSTLSKENKTMLALLYGVDLVVELPFIFGTQSADIFAEASITILKHLGCTELVFGSESNNPELLQEIALKQRAKGYQQKVKELLDTGLNYPTALAKALNIEENIFEPNDLLGISYIKAIHKLNANIQIHTIKRTSNYHDLIANDEIISASNIRHKLKNNEDISLFVPKKVLNTIENISLENFYPFLKYKILTTPDLAKYLTVDEGIENRLKEKILISSNLNEFIMNVKTKRYTYNKICRMLVHILIGVPKDINKLANIDYIKILGFNESGREYLRNLKDLEISLVPIPRSLTYKYEILASAVYSLISKNNALNFEKSNKPIYLK